MKDNPIELHRICKAYTYERYNHRIGKTFVTQLGYIGFAKPTPMKVIPSGLHMIGKACTYKGIPTGLHRIGKACTYESQPNWVT